MKRMLLILALLTFVALPLLAIGGVWFRIASAGAYRLTREKIAAITGYLQESLSGIRVVRAFGAEHRHIARFRELNEENRASNMTTVKLNAVYFPAVELLSALVTVEILLVGGYEVINGQIVSRIAHARTKDFSTERFVNALHRRFESVLVQIIVRHRVMELKHVTEGLKKIGGDNIRIGISPRFNGLIECVDNRIE